jgi:hypothetical protein
MLKLGKTFETRSLIGPRVTSINTNSLVESDMASISVLEEENAFTTEKNYYTA